MLCRVVGQGLEVIVHGLLSNLEAFRTEVMIGMAHSPPLLQQYCQNIFKRQDRSIRFPVGCSSGPGVDFTCQLLLFTESVQLVPLQKSMCPCRETRLPCTAKQEGKEGKVPQAEKTLPASLKGDTWAQRAVRPLLPHCTALQQQV
eukprot:1160235-Pelagomonas_calceolata.AAC.9